MTKPYSELKTEKSKAQRLAKYAKQREARGTEETLARIVRPAKINEIAGGNKQAVVRVAINEKGQEPRFETMTAFIKKGKDGLENYYASLQKGQLVSIEYKEANGYKNIYNMFNRESKAKKAKATVEQPLEA